MLIDGWTGLRWSELRAIRVRDFVEVPMPVFIVQIAEPEGVEVKVTKSRKSRRVPVADRILPMVHQMAAGRDADAPLLVTDSGHRLHATAFKRTLDWSVTGGASAHPRFAAYRCVPVADPWGRSGDGAGVDGTCLDRDDKHLLASPRDRR